MNIYYTHRHTNIQCILILRYLTSDKHHAHMYIVSLFKNDEHNVFDTCSTEIKFQKKKLNTSRMYIP